MTDTQDSITQDSIGTAALARLFTDARSHNGFAAGDLPETLMRAVYDLAKWGPTSANCSPARFVFIASPEAKARLRPFLLPGNVEKTMQAPWTVIVATDPAYAGHVPALFPHNPGAAAWFTSMPDGGAEAGFRNATLQGAYLIMAARALGLDCGPMSGFSNGGVDAEFLADTGWKSNFLINIGHGSGENLMDRLPRLGFDTACRVV